MKVIDSSSTTDGRITCELRQDFYYGATVYTVHVYETSDWCNYKETRKSYPTGSKKKAMKLYKDYKNSYVRNKKY